MAFYAEEDDVYKCQKHPLKRHRNNGVCPHCLKERLSALCSDCATLRPCSCSHSSTSSSSAESSSFSMYFPDGPYKPVSTLIRSDPPCSRRPAFPFFRSARFSSSAAAADEGRKSTSVSSVFRNGGSSGKEVKLSRSKSVVASTVGGGRGSWWYFPSPMKVFRRSKGASKVDHDNSPFHRGC